MRLFALLLAAAVLAAPKAMACGPEVEIRFAEAGPDRFRIAFTRGPKLVLARLVIALDGSAAGAVFDDYTGLFLQQPSPSGVAITAIDYAAPPDMSVTVTFQDFLEKREVDFRTDLDDRGQASDLNQNRIAAGELEGATARAILVDETGRTIEIDGHFDSGNRALLGERACV